MVRALTSVLLLGMFPHAEAQKQVHYALPEAGIVTIAAPAPALSLTLPPLTASGVLLIDAETGERLLERDSDIQRPMASLTKMMTALLIVENHAPRELVRIPKKATEQIGSTLRLEEGQTFSVEELLYALLLPSANDVAYALAIHHSGTVEAFVEKMNARAEALGLKDTRFANPAGYDDAEQYSTPRDLAWLSAAVLRKPMLRTIVTTPSKTIFSRDSVRFDLVNTNELLRSATHVHGMKTGTTHAAGQCLVTFFEEGGRSYLLVILGSSARYTDTLRVLKAVSDVQNTPAPEPSTIPVAARSLLIHERVLLSMKHRALRMPVADL